MEGFLSGFRLGLDLMWSIATAEPQLTGFLVVFGLGALLLASITNILKDRKLKRSGMLQVDQMKGKEFEDYLRVLFLERGYHVQMTPATGDYGADLILSKAGRRIAVQAKRYKKNVGLKAVQEVSTAKLHYKVDECWVVSNSGYTEPAKKLAASNGVKLVDRVMLMRWMLEMNKETATSKVATTSKIKGDTINKEKL
ncbi:restriction endonuclease [Planococcus alpniumensis]|uniref:restriction endonuclease n=1 Tax=Planococcus alpniumensis TaxID=2708345 RepID=UPI002013918A|nr:restriction endonuclease [Planococcus sp. MSAK28401]